MKNTQLSPRIIANRANAQKSTGPKSPEGKAISSQNAVRHGLCATTFILRNEDLDEYDNLRYEYMVRFGPRDRVEEDLVERMARCSFSQRRCWNLQNESMNLQMHRMESALSAQYSELEERSRIAAAFEELAKGPAYPLLLRYDARLDSQFYRALKTLLELRAKVPLVAPGFPPPVREPEPAPDPPNSQLTTHNSQLTPAPNEPNSPETTETNDLTPDSQPTTPNSQLITHNSQLPAHLTAPPPVSLKVGWKNQTPPPSPGPSPAIATPSANSSNGTAEMSSVLPFE